MIGVGVIGLGFMGRTHIAAYQGAVGAGHACELVAVCDQDASRLGARRAGIWRRGRSPSGCSTRGWRGYTEPGALLADPGVGLVSICTHTDTHVDLAIQALAAGKHVLAGEAAGPATTRTRGGSRGLGGGDGVHARDVHPVWPAYAWPRWGDRSRVRRGRTATFHRLGSTPAWADFYKDAARSGGVVDLHIHDTDFVVRRF